MVHSSCVYSMLFLWWWPVRIALSLSLSSTTTPADWLVERLAQYDLRVHDFSETSTTGRGLQTTRDRPAHDILLQVPVADAVTVSSLLQQCPLLNQAVEYAATASSEQQPLLLLTDEQVLATGLLWLKYHEHDRYALSLPCQQYSVLTLPDDNLLHTCLPVAYQKLIQAYRNHVQQLYQRMRQVLSQVVVNNEEDKDWVKQHFRRDAFLWAFATVRSRCVGMDRKDDDDARIVTGGVGEQRVLLPGFDILNHQYGVRTTPSITSDGTFYSIQSQQSYRAEEQVFISYSDERDHLQMLLTYGFVARHHSPIQVVTLDAYDLLTACAHVRPQYFTQPVIQQLWTLFEQLGKTQDLYTWNAMTQQPQESLQNSLDMMATLLQDQFLNDKDETDPTFASDLLTELLEQRRQELVHCQSQLQLQQEQSTKECWHPMWNAIQTLLDVEVSYLVVETTAGTAAAGERQ